jgi:hypothetical protein
METSDQQNTGNFNAELTKLRGANEAMTQRIEAMTRIVENLVTVQALNEDPTNTPLTNGNNLENPLLEDEHKSLPDPGASNLLTEITRMMAL